MLFLFAQQLRAKTNADEYQAMNQDLREWLIDLGKVQILIHRLWSMLFG